MDKGGYASAAQEKVKQFNGHLFKHAPAFALEREEIGELMEAAKKDWREVDPSIFGTLLEQALDPEERARLGAHYTPRAYVERLVIATVIEPLAARSGRKSSSTAERLKGEGKQKQAHRRSAAPSTKSSTTPGCWTPPAAPATSSMWRWN